MLALSNYGNFLKCAAELNALSRLSKLQCCRSVASFTVIPSRHGKNTLINSLVEFLSWHLIELTFWIHLICAELPSQLRLQRFLVTRRSWKKTLGLVFLAVDLSESYRNWFLKWLICCAIYRVWQNVMRAWPAAESHLHPGWVNEPAILCFITQSSQSIPPHQCGFLFFLTLRHLFLLLLMGNRIKQCLRRLWQDTFMWTENICRPGGSNCGSCSSSSSLTLLLHLLHILT